MDYMEQNLGVNGGNHASMVPYGLAEVKGTVTEAMKQAWMVSLLLDYGGDGGDAAAGAPTRADVEACTEVLVVGDARYLDMYWLDQLEAVGIEAALIAERAGGCGNSDAERAGVATDDVAAWVALASDVAGAEAVLGLGEASVVVIPADGGRLIRSDGTRSDVTLATLLAWQVAAFAGTLRGANGGSDGTDRSISFRRQFFFFFFFFFLVVLF